jgi:DNA-binding MarR family transcriptional regulator
MTAIGRQGAPDRQDLTSQIIAEFRAFMREVRCMGSDRMRRGGLSGGHFHLLSMLERHGEMPISRVADALDVSLSNASGLIDRLEERGLVERIRVPDDRRVVLVKITALGRQTLGEVEIFKDELLGRILGALDVDQLKRLGRALRDIEGAARTVLADDPTWLEHSQLHNQGRDVRHDSTIRNEEAAPIEGRA